MPDELKPTPAKEWRKRMSLQGELIALPGSGNIARLIRPALISMAGTTNGVPNPLSAAVQKLIIETAVPGYSPSAPKDDAERWANYIRNARAYMEIAALCLKEPRLVLDGDPPADAIGPQDLADYDYIWIYHVWIQGIAEQVAPFRVAVGADSNGRAGPPLRLPPEPAA